MTSDGTPAADVRATVRTAQIIVSALVMGVVVFAGFVIARGAPAAPAGGETMTLLALIVGLTCGLTSYVLPRSFAASNRQRIAENTWTPVKGATSVPQTDAEKLLTGYQTKTIIGVALLEGAAFLAITAYMLEGQVLSMVMAGILLAGMLAFFPTLASAEAWLDHELRSLKEERGHRH